MVGDGLHDVESGNAAGSLSCLLKNDWNQDAIEQADFVIDSLKEIKDIIEQHSE